MDQSNPPTKTCHRVIGGTLDPNGQTDSLVWETACGLRIPDRESEGRIVHPGVEEFNESVSCETCQRYIGIHALRSLGLDSDR